MKRIESETKPRPVWELRVYEETGLPTLEFFGPLKSRREILGIASRRWARPEVRRVVVRNLSTSSIEFDMEV